MSNQILLVEGVVEFFYNLADFLCSRSIPPPYSAFSDIMPVGRFGVPDYSLVGMEVCFQPFAGGIWGWVHIFFLFHLAVVEQLLSKIFCLASLPPFLVLLIEKQIFFFFLVCTSWYFQIASFLSFNSGIQEATEIQGTYHHVIPQVMRSLVGIYSFCLSESFHSCFIVEGFQLYLVFSFTQWEEQGKVYLLHLPRSKSPN